MLQPDIKQGRKRRATDQNVVATPERSWFPPPLSLGVDNRSPLDSTWIVAQRRGAIPEPRDLASSGPAQLVACTRISHCPSWAGLEECLAKVSYLRPHKSRPQRDPLSCPGPQQAMAAPPLSRDAQADSSRVTGPRRVNLLQSPLSPAEECQHFVFTLNSRILSIGCPSFIIYLSMCF